MEQLWTASHHYRHHRRPTAVYQPSLGVPVQLHSRPNLYHVSSERQDTHSVGKAPTKDKPQLKATSNNQT